MIRPARFEVRQTVQGSTLTLEIVGELDMQTAEILSRRLQQAMVNGVTELTLDLRELAFMDSTGLKVLIALDARSRQESWRLRLIAPEHEAATLVLRVTGADTALPFEPEPGG